MTEAIASTTALPFGGRVRKCSSSASVSAPPPRVTACGAGGTRNDVPVVVECYVRGRRVDGKEWTAGAVASVVGALALVRLDVRVVCLLFSQLPSRTFLPPAFSSALPSSVVVEVN